MRPSQNIWTLTKLPIPRITLIFATGNITFLTSKLLQSTQITQNIILTFPKMNFENWKFFCIYCTSWNLVSRGLPIFYFFFSSNSLGHVVPLNVRSYVSTTTCLMWLSICSSFYYSLEDTIWSCFIRVDGNRVRLVYVSHSSQILIFWIGMQ